MHRLMALLDHIYRAHRRAFNNVTVWLLVLLLAMSSGSVGYFLGDMWNNTELAAAREQHRNDVERLAEAYGAAMAERDQRLDELTQKVAAAARASQQAASTAERVASAPRAETPTRKPQGVPAIPAKPSRENP